jgi:adhesin transport system outer membrane protein
MYLVIKKILKKHTLPFFLVVFYSAQVWSIDKSQSEAMQLVTLEQMFKVAIQENSGLKVQKAELEAARSDLEAAKWQRFPSFSLEQNTVSNNGNTASAIIEQPIWSGGEISAQIGVADAALAEQKAKFDEAALNLLIDVAAAYYDVLRLEKRQEVAKENTQQHKKFLSAIKRRVDSQISPHADYVLADARYQQAIRQEFLAEQDLHSRQAELDRLTEGNLQPQDPSILLKMPLEALQSYVSMVLEASPKLASLRASIDKGKMLVSRERSSLWPKLVAQISSSKLATDDNYSDPSYGLLLKYNTGSGLSNMDKIKATNLRLDSSYAEMRYERQKIKQEARQMLRRYHSLKDQSEPAARLKESTIVVIDSYLRQFKIGKKSWLDVLNAQREKTDALNAAYDNSYVLEATIQEMLLMVNWEGVRQRFYQ